MGATDEVHRLSKCVIGRGGRRRFAHSGTVSDEDDIAHDFAEGAFAFVVPNTHVVGQPIDEDDYWVCQIVEIRARDHEQVTGDQVWAKIHWFYHPKDPGQKIPGFNPAHCGDLERIKSNHADCVSSSVFDGLVTMVEFDEESLEQEFIPEDTYFYRYELNASKKIPSITPKPKPTCVCDQPYNPSDPSPGAIMHLCPQPACRKYFHRSCVESSSVPGRSRTDYLLHDPDTGTPIHIQSANGASSSTPPAKRRRTLSTPTSTATPTLSALPPRLVHAATQPIVRGHASGVGVAGNVRAVMTARRMVCNQLQLQGDDAEVEAQLSEGHRLSDWEQAMPEGWEQAMVEGWDVDAGGDVVMEEGGSVKRGRGRPRKSIPPAEEINGNGKRARGGTKGKGKGKAGSESKGNILFTLSCPNCSGPI
ncbi:hypothetical protein C8F01DRAFT_1153878 [Mycena amicta]|nr:hypothetical protein C8F01DRAFT_1153878 [Mycena amicta]